jgi:Domain of unknown function (DUF929)
MNLRQHPRLRVSRRHRFALLAVSVSASMAAALGASGGAVAVASTKGPAAGVTRVASLDGVQVSNTVLEEIGLAAGVSRPHVLNGQPALTERGKPVVMYIGASFCPYCATARWALEIALAKFGTMTDGPAVSSSATDVDPRTASYGLHGSHYTSSYFSWEAADAVGNGFPSRAEMTGQELTAYNRYDKSPYTSYAGSIPFIDIDNRYLVLGSNASIAPLRGLTASEIRKDLSDPSSRVARAMDGAANYAIAALCSIAGNSSAAICSAHFVARAELTWARVVTTATTSTTTTSTTPTSTTTTTVPSTTVPGTTPTTVPGSTTTSTTTAQSTTTSSTTTTTG